MQEISPLLIKKQGKSGNRDFEDAVQMMAALQIRADYLLTRNVKDYQPAPLDVIQPVELLAILKQ